MPMFYTPKPRQFHYSPRLYDPKKEEWEKLKAKYHLDDDGEPMSAITDGESSEENKELDYFKRRVRELDREKREKQNSLKLDDMFRKREVPQFHYTPRFDKNGNLNEPSQAVTDDNVMDKRIKRRFDVEEFDRFTPIPAGKLILYSLLVGALIIFVFF